MEKINIRCYNDADKQSVLDLLRMNTPQYFAVEEDADFKEYLALHLEQYFVIEYDRIVVGCGGINFFPDHARISWDIIHPEYQNKGLGGLLLTHRIDILKQHQDVDKLIVRTSQHVYKFYEKYGFHLIETKLDYWAKGFDLYKLLLAV